MAVSLPAITETLRLWLERADAPRKPLVAARVERERDQLASAPSELLTPG